jgi:hypothetical protein
MVNTRVPVLERSLSIVSIGVGNIGFSVHSVGALFHHVRLEVPLAARNRMRL